MRRRDFIIFLAGAMAAWPLAGRAQQKAMPVIGVLNATSPSPLSAPFMGAFRQGLSEAGYVEGQNLAIEYRWAEGHYDRLPALAADLVGRKVDLIMASTPPSALAAKSATSTIPIVFRSGADPVADGLVASLARPGGNLTGVSFVADELTAKLELLSELVPRAGVIALLMNPNNATAERVIRDVQEATRTKGLQLHVLKARSESEIDSAFASLVQLHVDALVVGGDPFLTSRRDWSVLTRERSSRAPSPPICRSSSRRPSSWSSTLRPPRRWASLCRNRCGCAPTRLSSKAGERLDRGRRARTWRKARTGGAARARGRKC